MGDRDRAIPNCAHVIMGDSEEYGGGIGASIDLLALVDGLRASLSVVWDDFNSCGRRGGIRTVGKSGGSGNVIRGGVGVGCLHFGADLFDEAIDDIFHRTGGDVRHGDGN